MRLRVNRRRRRRSLWLGWIASVPLSAARHWSLVAFETTFRYSFQISGGFRQFKPDEDFIFNVFFSYI
jgi:hypothetical protein